MKTAITFEVDTSGLGTYTDEYIAQLWHIAQANPASIDDRDAGDLAEEVGREIIRRWLASQKPQVWNHQGRHYFWNILIKHGAWDANGEWQPNPAAPDDAPQAKADSETLIRAFKLDRQADAA